MQSENEWGGAGGDIIGIDKISYSCIDANYQIYGNFTVDCTKFSKLKFTLTLASATFSGGNFYLRLYESDRSTLAYTFSTNAGEKEVTLDSSWGSTAIILVYAKSTAQYGSVTFENIELTPI